MDKPFHVHETENYNLYYLDIGEGYIKFTDKSTLVSKVISIDDLEQALEKIYEKRR